MKSILFVVFLCFQIGIVNAETKDKKIGNKNLIQLNQLKSEVNKNLTENILPYWMKNMVDPVNGGFYGRIDSQEKKYPNEDKGGILNARILWTFSAAYRVTKDTSYLTVAKRTKDYILGHFVDRLYGGCLLYTSDAADEEDSVDLGGRRIIKK